MKKSNQQIANERGFGGCSLVNGNLEPCGYHKMRSDCRSLGLSSLAGPTDQPTVFCVPVAKDTVQMARYFEDEDSPPAGSWLLVREQRDWLIERLGEAVKESGATSLRILEAGTAGHVHHFGFLACLQEFLDQSGVQSIEVVTTDYCSMPLHAIQEVRRAGRSELLSSGTLVVDGYTVRLDPSFLELLETTRVLEDARITESVHQMDLTQKVLLEPLAPIDVVTEHFMSAVLLQKELLFDFRDGYASVLKPGGRLLFASGITRAGQPRDFARLVSQTESRGFELSEMEGVWDPYGATPEQVRVLLGERPMQVEADNTMFEFVRTAD